MIQASRIGLLCLLLGNGIVLAQSSAVGVLDGAGIFSRGAVETADRDLKQLRERTGWQVAIETIESLGGRDIQKQAVSNARKYQVRGLYVLLSKQDKRLFVEPSGSAESVFTKSRSDAIVKTFTDGLRQGKPDDGLKRAVSQISQIARSSPIAASSPNAATTRKPEAPKVAVGSREESSRTTPAASANLTGVRDNARMFSPTAVQEADRALKELERRSKWQAVVETVPSLEGRDIREATLERGRAGNVRGIYVLIDREGKKFHVDASRSAASVFDKTRIDAVVGALNQAFRAEKFDDGLRASVEVIRQAAEPATVATAQPPPPPATPTQPKVVATTPPTQPPTAPTTNIVPAAPKTTEAKAEAGAPPTAKPVTPKPPGPGGDQPQPFSGLSKTIIAGGLVLCLILAIWMLRRLFGGGSKASQPSFQPMTAPVSPSAGVGPAVGGQPVGGATGPAMGGQPVYGPRAGTPPLHGQPMAPGVGYPPGHGFQGQPPMQGGGFVSGALGGLAGAVVGNILYDQFGRPIPAQGAERSAGQSTPPADPNAANAGWPSETPASSAQAEVYHDDAGAGGTWNPPASPASEEWGAAPGAGGDWSTPEPSGPPPGEWGVAETSDQGDWATPSEPIDAGGDWGGDAGGDWGGGDVGGDWGGE